MCGARALVPDAVARAVGAAPLRRTGAGRAEVRAVALAGARFEGARLAVERAAGRLATG